MAKKSQTNGGGFSLRTKDATKGGGTEGGLATITEINFIDEYTYGGTQKDKPVAALNVVFDIEGFQKPWDQHYSVGPSDKYEVVNDGDGIRSAAGKQAGLNDNCAAIHFIASVERAAEAAGLDLDELIPVDEDGIYSVRPLEGKRVRLTNEKHKIVGGEEKEYLVIGSFEDDGAPTTKGKQAAKTNGKAAKGGDDIEGATAAAIVALIGEHTSVKKSDLANLVYQENKKDPNAKAMMQLCFKESWIGHQDRPWQYDKKKGVLRAAE